MVVLWGGAVSYERGTRVNHLHRPAGDVAWLCGAEGAALNPFFFFFFFIIIIIIFFFFFFTLVTGPRRSLSLKLSDTRVYEPQIRGAEGAALNPQPSASNPQPSTLKLKPQTLNPPP